MRERNLHLQTVKTSETLDFFCLFLSFLGGFLFKVKTLQLISLILSKITGFLAALKYRLERDDDVMTILSVMQSTKSPPLIIFTLLFSIGITKYCLCYMLYKMFHMYNLPLEIDINYIPVKLHPPLSSDLKSVPIFNRVCLNE